MNNIFIKQSKYVFVSILSIFLLAQFSTRKGRVAKTSSTIKVLLVQVGLL